ncbi:MAG TPA: hypothetical protein VFZ97_12980 [Acidimicrobiales bacterium]
MTLPRRAQATLGILCAFLLGGILGLAWWWRRHRSANQPVAPLGRVRVALIAAGLLTITVGVAWRIDADIQAVPTCAPHGVVQAASRRGGFDAWLLTQQVATAPETGIGLLYGRAFDAHICLSSSSDYYVSVPSSVAGTRATNLGDIVLSPGFAHLSREDLTTLAGHEARHRPQWAVATIIGGPLAFPVAYAVDDFFFPGSRNHFERLAGLESGGYRHSGTGPELGPAQLAALGVVATAIVFGLYRVVHRRQSSRTCSPDIRSDPT